MSSFPEKEAALKLHRKHYEEMWGPSNRRHGISEFIEHGVRVTVFPARGPRLLGDGFRFPDRSGERDIYDKYSITPGTLVGDMGFMRLNGIGHREDLPHPKSTVKHRIFQAMTEFFEAVDKGLHPEPEYLKIRYADFRLVRFFANWFGGDIYPSSASLQV